MKRDDLGLRRFLVRGGIWALAGRLATVAVALGAHALVARLLPPTEVGRFFLLSSVVLFARTAGGLGVGHTLVRRLGPLDTNEYPERATLFIFSATKLVAAGGLVLAILLATVPGKWLLANLGASTSLPLRALAAAWVLALVLEGTAAESFRGLRRIGHAIVFNGLLSSALLMLGLLLWSLRETRWEPQLHHVVLTAALAATLSATIGLARLVTTLPQGKATSSAPGADWRALLRPSAPILVSTLITLLVDQLGLWLLGMGSADDGQLALFGTAQRLARLVIMPLMIANAVLPPILARLDARNDRATLTATLRLSASLTFGVALIAAISLISLGAPIMNMVFGTYYQQGAPIVVVLALSQLVAAGCGSCGLMLLMAGNQRIHLLVSIVTLGIVLTGGILIRDSIDAWRMALVILAASVVQQVACVIAVRRNVGVWTLATLDPRRARRYWQRLATSSSGTRPSHGASVE